MPTVLIIDDSPTQAAYLQKLLGGQGLGVIHRTSNALESGKLATLGVDLVLMALILARHNGFECGIRLRETGVPNIVLYSDCLAATDAAWTQAIDLQGLLQIPAPPQQLRRQIHTLVQAGLQERRDAKRWAS